MKSVAPVAPEDPSGGDSRAFKATPEILSTMLEELDLTNRDLSRLCEVAPATVQRWLAGSGPIPMAVIRMCALMVHVRRAGMLLDVNHEHPAHWLAQQVEEIAV